MGSFNEMIIMQLFVIGINRGFRSVEINYDDLSSFQDVVRISNNFLVEIKFVKN